MISVEKLETALQTRELGHPVRVFETIESTNSAAVSWAVGGGAHGSLVLAETQTAGRGRRGRVWLSEPEANLTFSVILRVGLAEEALGLIPLAACNAVCDTVEELLDGPQVGIKWPNDVLIAGKKCCGILAESLPATDRGGHTGAVVLGIGLNVNQSQFPGNLRRLATSLSIESGNTLDRVVVLSRLLGNLELAIESLGEQSRERLVETYRQRLVWIGRRVVIRTDDESKGTTGILFGIDQNGALRLKINATEKTFHAGDVSLSPADPDSTRTAEDSTANESIG